MKKIVCVVLFLLCFLGSCLAQETVEYCSTYFYYNGVKQNNSEPRFRIITFVNDYAGFYYSDEYGNSKDNKIYEYTRAESDYLVYRRPFRSTATPFTAAYQLDIAQYNLLSPEQKFSKDLSVWNAPVPDGKNCAMIYIYKRVSKAEKEAILREYEESLPKLLR